MAKRISPVLEFNVGTPMRQCRFVPIATGAGRGFLVVHSNCAEVDPYHRMFFLATDTLKLTALFTDGSRLWGRDLGGGMIPGIWFCPVLPFDLDGDGADEIFLVNNSDPDHALDHESFALERISSADGELLESRPWPAIPPGQDMSKSYRNFINAAFSRGQRRLVTCQGTYGPMQLQCWDASMELVWERRIAAEDPGARGSHMCPVIDIDGDGREELLWGERCIDIDTGQDRWIGDEEGWRGHSDVVQPTLDRATGRWSVYTCREAGPPNGAVVMFDDTGKELWGRRGMGHMDMGWTARTAPDGTHRCYALEIGAKAAGPGGFERAGVTEYLFDLAGNPLPVEFPLYQSLPVDFNGDGLHELTYVGGARRGLVVDCAGRELFRLEGAPACGGKVLEAPGEQIITWDRDGTVRIYACPEAEDSPVAQERWAHPYYAACLRIWASGYNRANLGGL